MPGAYNPPFDLYAVPEVPQIAVAERIIGVEPETQTFYEGPEKVKDVINWVSKMPAQIPEKAKEKYEKVAIRVYKMKDRDDKRKNFGGLTALKFHSIEIQSPVIIKAIKPILAANGTLIPDERKITFKSPFQDLYFAYNKIVDLSRISGYEERRHLELLVQVMEELFEEILPKVEQLRTKQMISFSLLWTLLPKDILLYSRVDDEDRLYQFVEASLSSCGTLWTLLVRYVTFNGIRFGIAKRNIYIHDFRGFKRITDLSCYPAAFHPDRSLQERLLKRGEKILDFQDVKYREYNDVAKYAEEWDEDELYFNEYPYVTGRILIDTLSFSRDIESINVMPFKEYEKISRTDNGSEKSVSSAAMSTTDKEVRTDGRPSVERQRFNRHKVLEKKNYLLLLDPMLPGYSLQLKKWMRFSVDKIRHISWNTIAFQDLVLPEEDKDLVLTLVERHQAVNQRDDSIIAGKGNGLAFLLGGPPGTGKTLTVEAVADKIQKPLYYLRAEELGTGSSAIGGQLAKVFRLAVSWNAIVLLDEADIFLSKRSDQSTSHNAVVSTFLNQIEYYTGVVFFTTNLLSSVDDAFQSRINIRLNFSKHSWQSRLKIWQNCLKRSKLIAADEISETVDDLPSLTVEDELNTVEIDLPPEDIYAVGAWELNGREIQNVVRTARLWCSYRGLVLNLERLERVIRVTAPSTEKEVHPPESPMRSGKRQRLGSSVDQPRNFEH